MKVIYVHKGNHDYLNLSIEHIKKRVPELEIVLLGDDSNRDIPGVTWHKIQKNYDNIANEFEKKYKHFSPNGYKYELFCFLRWFYIYEYMLKNNVDRAMYIDSDVLLNEVDIRLLSSKSYCYCFNSGHTSAFTMEQIKDICKFISSIYDNKKSIKELMDIFERRSKEGLPGGVSDMTLLLMYAYNNSDNVVDLSNIWNLNVFDHNIQESDDFELYQGNKAIYYYEGMYYFRDNLTGMLIKVESMHFQGDAKLYMKNVSNVIEEKGVMLLFDYEKNQWINENDRQYKYKRSMSIKIKEVIYKINKKMKMIDVFNK